MTRSDGVKLLGSSKGTDSCPGAEKKSPALYRSTSPAQGSLAIDIQKALENEVAVITPFAQQANQLLQDFMQQFRYAEAPEGSIDIALREALANAIIHGNRQNPEKLVHATYRCTRDGVVQITVRDEGTGFDPEATHNPLHPENRLLSHGRGIYLIRALMDEVEFNFDCGTEVRMAKRLQHL
jgi:serine/threonine-protein kinase RsbW